MASQRGKTKLGFDMIALQMALKKDKNGLSASKINIKNIKDFPKQVFSTKEHRDLNLGKEKFVQDVLANSIEMEIIHDYYKISKLNIGITALGSSFFSF